ncbi:RNA polymerase sigma factor [Singulisphaera sp. GP187]|uniref:RNA polymerase sigma factor n=1 Tax=Singulisphaera sp. GP187 TaxID=1882752 RepID=UPI000941A2FC|nr:sigma-70 family RNA polymerase sigma factor [Singulisphaera sp. GP187]
MKAKDQEAWQRFVQLYGPLVYHWCRRFGLQEAEAADVGQEVFRTVSGSIAGFQRNQKGDSFRGWLRTITRTRTIDFLRRKAKEPEAVGGSDAQAMLLDLPANFVDEPVSPDDEEQILVRRVSDLVLENCKPESRQAFLRVVVAGEHPSSVAADLGMTVNAVYLAKSHILRRIREGFAQLVND